MKWEYKTLLLDAKGWLLGGNVDEERMEQGLNELGAQGWELVTGFDTNMHQGQTRHIVLVLKRAR